MRKALLAVVVVLLAIAPAAFAADDGETQPKLSSGNTQFAGDFYEIISTTSGTGNVKGIRCTNAVPVTVKIYVNGGSAQSLTMDESPWTNNDSGWLPLNVRFTSSIRVRMEQATNSSPTSTCSVSWAFD